MNRAATEDVRSPVWPVVSQVLHTSAAPSARDQQVVDILDDWVSRDAPRLDADNDGSYDEAGPAIMDALWRPIADAVMSPVFGALIGDLDNVRGLDGLAGESYVDKDLRTLLGEPVDGPFNLSYCGLGSLHAVRRLAVAGGPRDRRRARRAAGSGGPEPVAEAGVADRLRAGTAPEHVPLHQPPDLPAGAGVRPAGVARPPRHARSR